MPRRHHFLPNDMQAVAVMTHCFQSRLFLLKTHALAGKVCSAFAAHSVALVLQDHALASSVSSSLC